MCDFCLLCLDPDSEAKKNRLWRLVWSTGGALGSLRRRSKSAESLCQGLAQAGAIRYVAIEEGR